MTSLGVGSSGLDGRRLHPKLDKLDWPGLLSTDKGEPVPTLDNNDRLEDGGETKVGTGILKDSSSGGMCSLGLTKTWGVC